MGVLLDQTYGTHYLAIGGAFGSGEFGDDVPPGRRSFELMGVETVDGALAQLGHSSALLDLASLGQSSPASLWLGEEREWRMQDSVAILSAREGFDAIYYVDRVSRARLTSLALQRYQGQRE